MTKKNFASKLQKHDWHYARSDDKHVFERGAESYKALCEAFHEMPVDEARTLWLSIAPDNFRPPEVTVPKSTLTRTFERGVAKVEFLDEYGDKCSLEESDLPHCLLFGCAKLRLMHLTREQVGELIPELQVFVNTGLLPREP